MKDVDVPLHWVDAAMTGASPGCRDDARFYLANAHDTIREDLLWNILSEDPQVVCACGMSWDVLVGQGPDAGHGRTACESAEPVTVQLDAHTYQLHKWHLTRLAGLRLAPPTWQLSGWWRDYTWEGSRYGNAQVVAATLPGLPHLIESAHPAGKQVHVEMTAYGDDQGMFVRIRWEREE